jgi:hypothetical protein
LDVKIFISPFISPKYFPLPWREEIKARGDKIFHPVK